MKMRRLLPSAILPGLGAFAWHVLPRLEPFAANRVPLVPRRAALSWFGKSVAQLFRRFPKNMGGNSLLEILL